MNTIFNSKNNLKRLLNFYKNMLPKETYDYLDSLIDLKLSIFEFSTKEINEDLIKNNFYYDVALYNIYQTILNIIKTIDVLPVFLYTEKSNTRSYYENLLINGVYIPKNYKKASEYSLISLDYNFKEDTKIVLNLFKKDLPINADPLKLTKEEKESLITSELVTKLLQEFKINEEEFEVTQILKRTNNNSKIKTYNKECKCQFFL